MPTQQELTTLLKQIGYSDSIIEDVVERYDVNNADYIKEVITLLDKKQTILEDVLEKEETAMMQDIQNIQQMLKK